MKDERQKADFKSPFRSMHVDEKVGILLLNTGTTAAPRPRETRAYLREFLSDPRVMDVAAFKRWLIVNCFILPFRPRRSAEAHAKIWTDEGSPLLVISRQVRAGLKERLPGPEIELGMRYGQPSIASGFDVLLGRNVERVIVAPLFPQYSSAATGSALECVYKLAAQRWNVPPISVLPPFYDDPGFLDAWVAVSRPVLEDFRPEHILVSYHGLPERQVLKSDPTGNHCLVAPDCCDHAVPANKNCYRAHCIATTRALAERLKLQEGTYTTTFQSRLGSEPWLTPATDQMVSNLAERGVKRLAVVSPAFVADCLETLEEIGIRAKESFLEAGGAAFCLVPCLNSHPAWLDALAAMLQRF